MAAAAVLCLALGGAGGWVGHALHGVPAVAVAEAPATQDAVAAFRTFVVEAVHPVEVRADEKPHLVTWLSKRLGHAVAAPDLSAQGFRLMGGRLLPAGTEPAAMLMYDDDRGTRLTLYSRVGDGDGRTLFRFAARATSLPSPGSMVACPTSSPAAPTRPGCSPSRRRSMRRSAASRRIVGSHDPRPASHLRGGGRRQHVTRAAEALNLVQSAVSTAIANIEGRHATKLFHRVGRGSN